MPPLRSRNTTYAVVTPVLNEAANLERLAEALAAQTVTPRTWVIVDTGSEDPSRQQADTLASRYDWIRTLAIESGRARG